jgi:tetratricopeptide (TPR) repeat protein
MPRHVRLSIFAMLTIGFALFGASASAQRRPRHAPPPEENIPPPTQTETAMHYFELATEEYRTGLYQEAAAHLEQALVLDPEAPILLFNLGRVYELMHRYDEAMNCFERLLAVTPLEAEGDRARTEEALARIRGARERALAEEERRRAEELAAPPVAPIRRQPGLADEAFWGTLVTGGVVSLAAIAIGTVTLLQRESLALRPISAMFQYDSYRRERETIQTLALVADVGGAVGAATIATALLLFGLRDTEVVMPVAVEPSSSGLQLTVRGTF